MTSKRTPLAWVCALTLGFSCSNAFALFDDNEARQAIVELRKQVTQQEQRIVRLESSAQSAQNGQANLIQQLQEKDRELARLRNDIEIANNNIRKLQEDNRVLYTTLENRIKQLEPKKVEVDGKETTLPQDQYAQYQSALDTFKSGNYNQAIGLFQTFLAKYPKSNLDVQARYFLGSAQFAQGDYKSALITQRDLAKEYPDSPRAPDALLSMASAQLELKAIGNAKKTLGEIIARYPNSAAATSAKTRLDALK
jgi:tol-pal system protein YbgF